MSIAPKLKQFQDALQEIHALSEAILGCNESDMETLQVLMDKRETSLQWLASQSTNDFSLQDRTTLNQLLEQVKAQDAQIETHFNSLLSTHATAVNKNVRTRKALAHYKFPQTSQFSGIENQA